MSAHLSCEGVTVAFGGVVACDKVSMSIEEGRIVGLIGPNGAGKTTLFNVLTRFQDFSAGHVYYRERRIDRLRPHHMAALGMARTFQNINLFAGQSVRDNILIGAHHLIGNPLANMFWLPAARRNERTRLERALSIAEMLHIGREFDSIVSSLPYGLQKRVELARALASEPEIVLLDEPVAGCNDEETEELKDIVRRVNQELGITIFLVEHDMSMVMTVCDYIYVMNFGANLAAGTPGEVRADPGVIKAYLGEEQE